MMCFMSQNVCVLTDRKTYYDHVSGCEVKHSLIQGYHAGICVFTIRVKSIFTVEAHLILYLLNYLVHLDP